LGEKDYATVDLDEAVKYLERAAKSDDPVARKAAEGLVSEVRDLHQLIETGDKSLGTKLESAWHRVKALSERSAEYISTGWQRLRAEGAGKKDLIEAKLQLANARIDHFYSKDDAAAEVDLAAATGYLDSAAGKSSPDIKTKVAAVAGLVQGLEKGIGSDKSGADDAESFHKAEAQLSTLIQQL
jgi:TPR repeat protein